MRQIEKDMLRAIRDRRNWRAKNTRVEVTDDVVNVYLHGNRIARYWLASMTLDMTLCGWPTVTTRSRLNAIVEASGVGLHWWTQKNHKQHCGGVPVSADQVVSIREVFL